jgi:hypothetical protein
MNEASLDIVGKKGHLRGETDHHDCLPGHRDRRTERDHCPLMKECGENPHDCGVVEVMSWKL